MRAAATDDTNIIFGATIDDRLNGQLWITVVATGLGGKSGRRGSLGSSSLDAPSFLRDLLALPSSRVAAEKREDGAMRGAVAAGHPLTAEAGARVLEEGGNAVDACVAAAFRVVGCRKPADRPGGGRVRARASSRRAAGRLADFFVATPVRSRAVTGGRDARDRRRVRRRRAGVADLPDRRALVCGSRRGTGLKALHRPTAACRGTSCSRPRSSWRGAGVELTRPQAHLYAILDLILRHTAKGGRPRCASGCKRAKPTRGSTPS